MKVLVSGGAGFIGSHTVDVLLVKGYEVRIMDSLEPPVHLKGRPDYVPEEVEFILGDVRNKADWESALKGIEVVFHFAAYQDYLTDFSKFFDVNSRGTALLYEVIVEKKPPVEKVMVASSQAVYGEGKYKCSEDGIVYPDPRSLDQLKRGDWELRCPKCGEKIKMQPSDESRVNPANSYGISKYSQELISLTLGKRYTIPTTCLRYSIVQGPRQSPYNLYSGALRAFALSVYFGKEPLIYEDGLQLRDYVNIEDAVRANLLALEDERTDYEVYNVGGGKAYRVLELAGMVGRAFGDEVNPKIAGEFRFGDTRHIVSDISKIKALGWKPINSMEKSVGDYVAWLKEEEVIQDLAEYTQKKMKDQGVVRKAKA
ncbi:dTDP-L-rhamnose 4-epimerase [subsurface metagenome]